MSCISVGFLNNYADYYRFLPLLTPCLKKNSYKKDFDLTHKRTLITLIGTPTIGTMVFLSAPLVLKNRFAQISADTEDLLAMFVIPISIACMTISIWDERRTNQTLDVKAVEEYINPPVPSKKTTFHIRYNLTALQLLIARKGDVNKLNNRGERLLDYTPDLKIYKLLAKHADTTLIKTSYFEKAIKDKKSKYLKCILENNQSNSTKIIPDDFTAEQQMEFWIKAGCLENIDLLKKFGFNVNIQNRDGCTPLVKLLELIS